MSVGSGVETGDEEDKGCMHWDGLLQRRRVERHDTRGDDAQEDRDVSQQDGDTMRIEMSRALDMEAYECMVCFERIRRRVAIWSCPTCCCVIHLSCIRKWAESTLAGQGSAFRCPNCQAEGNMVNGRLQYRCFCGKQRDPGLTPGVTAHSCGDICGKTRHGGRCPHPCPEMCHPGFCPPCPSLAPPVTCMCGRVSGVVRRCADFGIAAPPPGTKEEFRCTLPCPAPRKCEHPCVGCHRPGQCEDCEVIIGIHCWCGKELIEVPCFNKDVEGFQCLSTSCSSLLDCGVHACGKGCHPGPCGTCPLSPSEVRHCACGKRPLTVMEIDARQSCIDPVPTCDALCFKVLTGCLMQPAHRCPQRCGHDTGSPSCPPCAEEVTVFCECRSKEFEVVCGDDRERLRESSKCDTVCKEKKSCRRHRCEVTCCPLKKKRPKTATPTTLSLWSSSPGESSLLNHICTELCGKTLSCGSHSCDLACGHFGDCPKCGIMLHERLTCFCGASVHYPPVRCGTVPPSCRQSCTRPRSCPHPCPDFCHQGECPKCVEMVSRSCAGGHGETRLVPCFLAQITCSKKCARELSCGLHLCQQICHIGACGKSSKSDSHVSCGGSCLIRRTCGHPCRMTCHPNTPCPNVTCEDDLTLKCPCERREVRVPCARERRILGPLNPEVLETASGQLRLNCNDECRHHVRVRNFAEALGVVPSNLSQEVRYPPELLDAAGEDLESVVALEQSLEKLVLGQLSRLDSDSDSGPPRGLVHELCSFYGLDSETRGRDPFRRVVVFRNPSRAPPRVPSPLLSEAWVRHDQRAQRMRTLREIRRLWICLEDGGKITEEVLVRTINMYLKAHSGFFTILRKVRDVAPVNSMDVLVEFSSRERMKSACLSLRSRPGVRLRQCHSSEEGNGADDSVTIAIPSSWEYGENSSDNVLPPDASTIARNSYAIPVSWEDEVSEMPLP